jgi:hypothetical protein
LTTPGDALPRKALQNIVLPPILVMAPTLQKEAQQAASFSGLQE